MPTGDGLIKLVRHVLEMLLPRPGEPLLDILVEVTLIAFEAQHIVSTALDNLLSNGSLAAHGTNPWRSRTVRSSGIAVISLDFSSTLTWASTNRCALAQAAHHMNGTLAAPSVIGMAQRLAVNANLIPGPSWAIALTHSTRQA